MSRLGPHEFKYIKQVFESELLSWHTGTLAKELEARFAKLHGVGFAVASNSCMSSLHEAVAAAGAGPGKEVICDPIVHFGAASAMYHNAVPVFADVDPYTYNMDPDSAAALINERTVAILVTNIFGAPAHLSRLRALADDHGVKLIEDNAQAIGATHVSEDGERRLAGAWGHVGCFSFEQSKQITSGDGSMAITDEEELAHEMRKVGLIGWTPEVRRDPIERGKMGRLGWNFRMTELTAALIMGQLDRFDEIIGRHKEAGRRLASLVADCPWIVPQRCATPNDDNTYYQFAARFEGDRFGLSMERFKALCEEHNADARFHYTKVAACNLPMFTEPRAYGLGCPIHCPHYTGNVRYGPEVAPVAQDVLDRLMLLPFFDNEAFIEAFQKVIETVGIKGKPQ